MKKSLVIVESPAKAKTIGKFIGDDFVVKSSMGHVRDLPAKSIGIEIDEGFIPKYTIMPDKKRLVAELKKEAQKAENIYLAPDPDREGEAIAWHLAEIFKGMDKEIFRVSFNEITAKAVQEAFAHPGRIDLLKVSSQQARRILDRIVGYKISPFLWKKVAGGLSAGRVQSVALRLVCEREDEIKNFVPREYWTITATLQPQEGQPLTFPAKLEKIGGEKAEITDEKGALDVVSRVQGKPFTVSDIQSKNLTRSAPPPFITSTLQQAASTRLHWPIARVMKIAQELYEGLDLGAEGRTGLITYMRTDSVRVSEQAVGEARAYIGETFGAEYLPKTPNRFRSKKSAQEAHEAIRPANIRRTPQDLEPFLSREQAHLYRLIWDRFCASQMTSSQMRSTTASITVEDCLFLARGLEVLFKGYTAVYNPDEDDEENDGRLPEIRIGQALTCTQLDPKQNFTKPQPRYTEASLVKILEEKGIGRPSTYATIIQTIYARNYVLKETGKLQATELGQIVNTLLTQTFQEIMNVEFTAQMEERLDEIEEGKTQEKDILTEFYQSFSQTLKDAYTTVARIKPPAPQATDEVCEKCGKPMVIRTGSRGRFIACSGYPACKNTRPMPTGVKCPKCGGPLVQRRSKKGRNFFGCGNYPKCDFAVSRLSQATQPGGAGQPGAQAADGAAESPADAVATPPPSGEQPTEQA